MKVLKRLLSLCSVAICSSLLFGADFQIRLMPSIGLQSKFDNSMLVGATAALDLNAFTVRQRDDIFLSLQGTGQLFIANGLDPFPVYDVTAGAGYNFKINDRFSVALEAFGGLWFFPEQKQIKSPTVTGITFGADLAGYYNINPYLAASAFIGYKQYYYQPEPFLNNFQIGLGITYNFTKGLFSSSAISMENYELQPLFPVFYSRYENNSFGTVVFRNGEKNDITDVMVSVYIEQFMSVPNTVVTYDVVKFGEEFTADLSAFLNENMLNQLQNQLSDAEITVSYRSLGRKLEFTQRVSLQTLTRNSMSWEDDRSAAAFVSAKDGAVQRFARRIALALNGKIGKYPNVQYAEAVFNVLKAYGINYVIDPASAFTDNVGTASIDFLQFPYQTLLYHGGDCDDLSILNCSLLEALGVPTAFITIPGHIYMAFDSGIPKSEADAQLGKGKYVVIDDTVWVPVEITVPQDSYRLALSLGMRQWNKYPDDHALIPIAEAWKEYKPVSVPASDITLQFPKDALK